MRKELFILLIVFLVYTSVNAQDGHYSQFYRSYLQLNPALSGSFQGSYRFNVNYRNQWSSISEAFRTFSIAADAHQPFEKAPNLHLGVFFLNDQAGVGDLTTNQFYLSTAYTYKLNSDSTLILKGGMQAGFSSQRINFDQLSFDAQYQNGSFDNGNDNGEQFDRSSFNTFNLNLGAAIEFRKDWRNSYEIGYSVFNLFATEVGFANASVNEYGRLGLFARAQHQLSDKIDLLPSFLASAQGPNTETVFGLNGKYYLNQNNYYQKAFYLGLWLRTGDAIIPFVGLDYNQWKFGATYDINTSSLDVASDNRGGLELSLTYIITTFKPTLYKYRKCPKFL